MCLFCDALEQWVCSCGAIVAIGDRCECGERQSSSSNETESFELPPNRAARRRRR
jgi:hypothetical protein